jgi:hypothetical protein
MVPQVGSRQTSEPTTTWTLTGRVPWTISSGSSESTSDSSLERAFTRRRARKAAGPAHFAGPRGLSVEVVTSLTAEADSFTDQPQNLLGCARRPPEGPVRPHLRPYPRGVTPPEAAPRAPIPLTAEAASPLGAI